MTFNLIDVLLVLLILMLVVNGWRRGFLRGSLDLLSWSLGLLAALRFYPEVASWLGNYINWWSEVWDRPIAFVIVALGTGICVELIGYAILARLSEDVHERSLNRLLGVVPGFASAIITAAIVSSLLLAIPLNEGLRERARESPLVNRLAVYTERLEVLLHPVSADLAEAIAKTFNFLTIRPESDERVELPFKVSDTRSRPDLEARMLQMVNAERIANGLKPLAPDPELTEVARRHSTDMFGRGYFAHDTPEGRDPFDRMRESGVQFLTAGENLALAPTVQVAHTGLMNSPGHRANILHKDFGRVGIGIMDGGIRGLMVSQEFRN